MHVHFGSGGLEPAEATTTDRILRQFLYYGVTTVFNVGGGRANASSIRALRSQVTSDAVTAPQIYATGSMLTLPGSHPVGTILSVPDGVDPETYDWSGCDPGDLLTGGGYNGGEADMTVFNSAPRLGPSGLTWAVSVLNESNSSKLVSAFAVCVKVEA